MGRTASGPADPAGRDLGLRRRGRQAPGGADPGRGPLRPRARSRSSWRLAYLFRATRARRPGMPADRARPGRRRRRRVRARPRGVRGRALPRRPRLRRRRRQVELRGDATRSARRPRSSARSSGRPSALALGFAHRCSSALNAMRVGLLTRFMGVLGVIVGVAVALILPIDQQGIIRVFWLAALGVLFLGRWPTGMPKAWATGEAEPWPTQQQLREQRDAAAGRERRGRGDDEPGTPRASGRGTPATPPPMARARAVPIPPPPAASTARRRRRSASGAPERLSALLGRPAVSDTGQLTRRRRSLQGNNEVSTSNREGISWKLELFSLEPAPREPAGGERPMRELDSRGPGSAGPGRVRADDVRPEHVQREARQPAANRSSSVWRWPTVASRSSSPACGSSAPATRSARSPSRPTVPSGCRSGPSCSSSRRAIPAADAGHAVGLYLMRVGRSSRRTCSSPRCGRLARSPSSSSCWR